MVGVGMPRKAAKKETGYSLRRGDIDGRAMTPIWAENSQKTDKELAKLTPPRQTTPKR